MSNRLQRITPNSRAGRSLIRVGKDVGIIPDEIAAHNAEIDRKKEEKKRAKQARKPATKR